MIEPVQPDVDEINEASYLREEEAHAKYDARMAALDRADGIRPRWTGRTKGATTYTTDSMSDTHYITEPGHEMTWREYARILGEDQARLYYLTSRLTGAKWSDLPALLATLKPEDAKYVTEPDLYAAIDCEIAKERRAAL